MSFEPAASRSPRARRFFLGVTAHPGWVLLLSGAVLAACLAGLPRLSRDPRADAFIPADHPAVVYRDKVEELFGLRDPVVVAIAHAGPEGIFRPESLALVQWLSDEIAELPGIDDDGVTSLSTENDILGTEDGMLVEPFFEDPPATLAEARAIRQAVLEFELYRGNLVASDGSATLVVAEISEGEEDGVYAQVQALVDRAPRAGEEIWVAGEGAVTAQLGSYIDADARRLNPISALVITLVLLVAYRTWRGVLLPNAVVLGTVGIALGSMAWAGVPLYVITNSLPPLLIAVAVADGIHILGQYYEEVAAAPDADARTLVVRTMEKMWRPVTLTSVTDVAGFSAIALASFMPPMRAYGVFASVGILGALAFSLLTLPAALVLLRPRSSRAFPVAGQAQAAAGDRFGRLMTAFGRAVVGHPKVIVAAAAAVALAGAVGASSLRVDWARIEAFNEREPIRRADAVINGRISGTTYLDVVIEAPAPAGLFQPQHLAPIEALQRFLEAQPHVAKTTSIVDYLKQMNRSLHADRADMQRLPESAELVAQYFLLYEASGSPTDFEEVVDYDYRQANVRAALDSWRFSDVRVVVAETEAYLDEHFADAGLRASIAGQANVDVHWIGGLAESHFRGVGLALVAIFLTTGLAFRSLVAGLLCGLPVTVSVLLLYAVMGATGIDLGVGTTMFAAIALGTGVDFAVHTVDRLVASVRDRGTPLEPALRELFPSTGRALLFSFAALALGFSVLLTSHVPVLVHFGALVATAASVAFLASLTVGPAVVLLLRPAFLTGADARPALARAAGIGVLALLLGAPDPARAQDELLSGDEIARNINARDDGQHVSRRLSMELINRRGSKRVRTTRGYRKYYGQEKRTVLFYESPQKVKDTAFLTYDYPEAERDDDQWLYLPALRKVRRISASDRGDYFLGTDFTYEDIKLEGKVDLDDYTRKTLRMEEVDGVSCYVVENVPVSDAVARELGYGRVVSYVDPEIWMMRKADFWNRKGKPLKTVRNLEIQQVDGIWTAMRIEADNHKTGHRTVFVFSDVDYEAPVEDGIFTERALRRGR
ncbi:MAG: outer membrane lipoprotein-sorting protein [Proteobacteria bacterium]|nr:outer membrane lipoprotein-sorting protein [Pseudomonadota bacterium]